MEGALHHCFYSDLPLGIFEHKSDCLDYGVIQHRKKGIQKVDSCKLKGRWWIEVLLHVTHAFIKWRSDGTTNYNRGGHEVLYLLTLWLQITTVQKYIPGSLTQKNIKLDVSSYCTSRGNAINQLQFCDLLDYAGASGQSTNYKIKQGSQNLM